MVPLKTTQNVNGGLMLPEWWQGNAEPPGLP